ncbi:MAG: zinc ribbon domain-containing protein [Gammaproteobacteria bacterium]|nr:MAG: zinc ribbon domain-containing protein [Gammaproteobacteria bacterium]
MMPIYEYAAVAKGCAYCEAHFDLRQKLADAELTACPRCGAPVQRVLSAPNVAVGGAHLLKESNIEKKGFTQYRRAGKGVYEKTAGKGPKYISGD